MTATAPSSQVAPSAMSTGSSPWIGWLELQLLSCHVDRPGERRLLVDVGVLVVLDVCVRRDVVTVWLGSRTLAVVDREEFNAWARRPLAPLRVDDLAFSDIDGRVSVRIDGAGPFPVTRATATRLIEHV